MFCLAANAITRSILTGSCMITFTSCPSPVDNVKAVPLLSTYKKEIIRYQVQYNH